MPNLTFVLPHWMYWAGLIAFPLLAMFMLRQHAKRSDRDPHGVSHGIAYFLLITAGFIGMHRLYLRNLLGLIYIPLFIVLLHANTTHRDIRVDITNAKTQIVKSEFLIKREEKNIANGREGAEEKLLQHQQALAAAQQQLADTEAEQDFWNDTVVVLASIIFIGLLIDALLIPGLLRQCREMDRDNPVRQSRLEGSITAEGGKIDPETDWFSRGVGRLNGFCGAFVAYWSVIAVIVYYYEVVARYVFNSPTNWAHESMFLMFGAQYLIAGGFCLRENAHVRVDVFYMHFSKRTKAKVDIATSVFFFIFLTSLLFSGWTFFLDSYSVGEVSFTEWGIQYYPIKLTIALGALLLLLQGVARLLNDIKTLRETS